MVGSAQARHTRDHNGSERGLERPADCALRLIGDENRNILQNPKDFDRIRSHLAISKIINGQFVLRSSSVQPLDIFSNQDHNRRDSSS